MLLGLEIEACARCGGKPKIIASIEEPAVIAKNQAHLERTAPRVVLSAGGTFAIAHVTFCGTRALTGLLPVRSSLHALAVGGPFVAFSNFHSYDVASVLSAVKHPGIPIPATET